MELYFIIQNDRFEFWNGRFFHPEYPEAKIFSFRSEAQEVRRRLLREGNACVIVKNYGQADEE